MAKANEAESFGRKLRRLREAEGLSIEELAIQLNMKPAYLAKLEKDEILPPVAEILTISRRLAVQPSTFMPGPKPGKAGEGRQKALEKRTRDYAYRKLTAEDIDGHLMAFEVTIDPESEHRKVVYRHEGEEFIYVLSGRLKITVGRKTKSLQKGQSIHFDSSQKHILRNPGKEPSRLLVVVYAP
jgi:transcriptional regulator with XRE-family HTH domain